MPRTISEECHNTREASPLMLALGTVLDGCDRCARIGKLPATPEIMKTLDVEMAQLIREIDILLKANRDARIWLEEQGLL